MLYPEKTLVLTANGFHLEKGVAYRDFLTGRWYLQIQSVSFTGLPAVLSTVAKISTSFVKSVDETIFGNYESSALDLHIFNLNSNEHHDYFTNFPPVKYLISDPQPVFSVDIHTPSLSADAKSQCKVILCCNFFKEL